MPTTLFATKYSLTSLQFFVKWRFAPRYLTEKIYSLEKPTPFEAVEAPVKGQEAFAKSDDAAVLSQAAILLLLGAQIRGDHDVLVARAAAAAKLGGEARTGGIPAEDVERLGLPPLRVVAGRIDPQRIQEGLASRYKVPIQALEAVETLPDEIRADLFSRFVREPGTLAAAELMESCLRHPQELVRVAAAASYCEISSNLGSLLAMLEQGTRSTDELVREVAATALANVAADSGALPALTQKGAAAAGAAPAHTTLLVHGTWARLSTWWGPGGDFHAYLTGVLPTLARTLPLPSAPPWDAPYAGSDRFEWSGGYSDGARAIAAQDLLAWVDNHHAQGLDLITHSHGGSVAMLASQASLNIKELVLLSCPVHAPKYQPDFGKVKKVVSIRVHLDLVILADRGGQHFNDPRIKENVLPVWFNHSATHDRRVWQKHNVPTWL